MRSLSPRYVNPDPSGEDGVHNTDYHTSLLLSLMTAEVESLEQLRGGYLSQLGRLAGGREAGRENRREGWEGGREGVREGGKKEERRDGRGS